MVGLFQYSAYLVGYQRKLFDVAARLVAADVLSSA